MCDRFIFTPDGSTNDEINRVAGVVTILREILPPERDEEAGPMFEIRNVDNGHTIHAFADELKAIDIPEGKRNV